MEYNSEEDLMAKAETASGKTFDEIDKTKRLSNTGKGNLGQIIEESLFEYAINNNPRPDFENLGIELKVTPVKQNKNKSFSAKERLVLNIINYMEEYKHTFDTSSFWLKNRKLLIMFYLWKKDLDKGQYKVIKSILYEYPNEDLIIIRNDWEHIVDKIKAGKAHEISESDTNYLAACTKGANKNSLRPQPFSDKLAKQRAFSLKQSYMTTLIRQNINQDKLTRFASTTELKSKSIAQLLQERFNPFMGLNIKYIAKKVNINYSTSNKAMVANIVSAILGIKGTKLKDIEEFQKANIQFKTIRLEPNGIPKEHMSFETIDFNDWINLSFGNSQVYNKFEKTKFLFVIFEYRESKKENPDRLLFLKNVKLWNMPEKDINNYVYPFWEKTKKILLTGVKLTQQKRGISNNLPGANYNNVIHIRPKAQNADDKTTLPDGQMITKQCYWLDRQYISRIISE